MSTTEQALVDRLAALPALPQLPDQELEWLASRGKLRVFGLGEEVAAKGQPVDTLWIIMSGTIAARVDRGSGLQRVMGWGAGEVSGMLPYSRMRGPPGPNYAEEPSELLMIGVEHFPEMVSHCPNFTAHTVHLMLDRARRFRANELQDEKMISLGRLAAGLAHELNNPASAAARGAKLLLETFSEAEAASRGLGRAGLTDDQLRTVEAVRVSCQASPVGGVLSPLKQADREDEIGVWLESRDQDPALTMPLGDTAITIGDLDTLAETLSGDELGTALRWIAAGCSTYSLISEVGNAAGRMHDLVAAVKKFTYMDSRAGSVLVDVAEGLRDTVRVVSSKAKTKGVSIELDLEPGLPSVTASGAELNQVWLNLIDNALDAVDETGRIEIKGMQEGDHVVVSVIDNGRGIPEDVLPRIFDAFFTTKPPGEGTGLGLELTRRLVRQYRGDLSVDSRPGRTTFRVTLPLAQGEPEEVEV